MILREFADSKFRTDENFGIILSYFALAAIALYIFTPKYVQATAEFEWKINLAKYLWAWSFYSLPIIILYSTLNIFVANRIIVSIIFMQICYMAATLLAITLMEPLMLADAQKQGPIELADFKNQVLLAQVYAVSGLAIILIFLSTQFSKYMTFITSIGQSAAVLYAYFYMINPAGQ